MANNYELVIDPAPGGINWSYSFQKENDVEAINHTLFLLERDKCWHSAGSVSLYGESKEMKRMEIGHRYLVRLFHLSLPEIREINLDRIGH